MSHRLVATRRAALLGALAWIGEGVARADAVHTQRLFAIERSKNANIVRYDVRVRGSGLDRREPMTAYWILHAEDGRREALGFLERRLAYGFDAEFTAHGEGLLVRLRAFPARGLTVERDSTGRYQALMTIGQKRARLERLFVATDEAGVTPRVRFVDLHGTALASGQSVSERVVA